MSIKSFFEAAIGKRRDRQYLKMMRGYTPVFSSFGNDIYASDIVQNAVRRICTELSKLEPRHIRIDETGMRTVVRDEIERLLLFGPNPIMTTSDFMEKICYMREIKKNAYIIPVFDRIELPDGKYKRKYTALYPINPSSTVYTMDSNGTLWITFKFDSTYEEFTFRYADVIHWRKDYTENDIQGGDVNGNPNPESLMGLLQTDHTAVQSIDKGVKSSNAINGIVKQNTMLDDDDLSEKTKVFEQKIMANQTGFLVMDLKSDFIQTKIEPAFVEERVMEHVVKRILATWGMSLKIYNGDFDDESYQAFYEAALEPMIISLGRAFTRVLFTDRELDIGHRIVFYNEGLQYMKIDNKVKVATILTNIGALMDNQVLEIFGYPPFEGGNMRHQSLNWVNREMADTYQMMNARRRGGGMDGTEEM